MTQNPYSSQNQPPPVPNQPMNIYPVPGAGGGAYPAQPPRPAWPTVVAIISLCIAGVFGLMTVGGPLLTDAMQKLQPARQRQMMEDRQREMMENMPGWFRPYQWIGGVFTTLSYVVLAIGGVMLLQRRRAARALHFTYALMGVLVAIAGLVVMITMMDYMAPPANISPAGRVAFKAGMAVSAIAGLAFGLAYPVFLLIWFSRKTVNEHIRTWTS